MRFYGLDIGSDAAADAVADQHVSQVYEDMVRRLTASQLAIAERDQIRALEARIRGEKHDTEWSSMPNWENRLSSYASRLSFLKGLEDEVTDWIGDCAANTYWSITFTLRLSRRWLVPCPSSDIFDVFQRIRVDLLRPPYTLAGTWPFDVEKDRRDYYAAYKDSATWEQGPPAWWTALASSPPTR